MNKIIEGDCLDILKTLEENSVDSICCDPPYELGFMGKSWDNTGIANNKEMWAECLRVLKPGGHLLAFSGTRTYHRMACAIEDAGFEVRDMIEWVYGCLSEDTEILTESGYKPLHKLTQYDRIGVYDITNNIYKWERPQRYSVYKVHQDTAYRIKSDYTDQIVSRNHRCLVEREGKLVFIQAEELNEVEYMPTLSDDFYTLQEGHRKLLLKELLWKGKRLAQKVFSKWTGNKKSEERIEVRKEPSLERWSNLLEETRKLQADKICEVSEGVFTDGEKRWICNGTSFDNGSILGDMFRENPSSASYQSRPTGQPTGKPDVISIKQGTQITRRARVTKIEYSGIIFCPTVSTGAFIARRNGKVFITGNSGFPKSLNIGKAINKIDGVEFESKPASGVGFMNNDTEDGYHPTINQLVQKGESSDRAKQWEGWGTALKPAHEPICMARKPLAEKTVALNVLKYGTGGINIDESRVDVAEKEKESFAKEWDRFQGGSKDGTVGYVKQDGEYDLNQNRPQGRFPANLIHDNSEEVRECFPETKGAKETTSRVMENPPESWKQSSEVRNINSFNDSGNASRFFKGIPQVVDLHDFSIYNRSILTKIKQLCGQHLTKKKTDITLDGVIQEVEKFIQDAELLMSGNSTTIEKFLTDTASITKTLIAQMIELKTLNVLPNWLITKFTEENEQTIKLLKELNTEDVKSAKSIFLLQTFISEVLESIRAIAEIVAEQDSNNGDYKSLLYQAKASKSERNKGCDGMPEKRPDERTEIGMGTFEEKGVAKQSNFHPTVKPIALMEYLIKMVTPKGGIVLDPFAGSGSTLIAAKQNNFQYIGIEMEADYIKIAEARLNAVPNNLFND